MRTNNKISRRKKYRIIINKSQKYYHGNDLKIKRSYLFNEKFENFAKKYPNIRIVEWDKVAKEHPEYLEPDKIHPNYKGGKVLVQLIFDMICEDYSK